MIHSKIKKNFFISLNNPFFFPSLCVRNNPVTDFQVTTANNLSTPIDSNNNLVPKPFNLPIGYIYSQRTVSIGNGETIQLEKVYKLTNGSTAILIGESQLDNPIYGEKYTQAAVVGYAMVSTKQYFED